MNIFKQQRLEEAKALQEKIAKTQEERKAKEKETKDKATVRGDNSYCICLKS